MCSIYILYSLRLDKYYTGYTCDDIDKRINKHNSNHKGFTGDVGDWELVYMERFTSQKDAMNRERFIKKKKSRKYIEYLIQKNE